jgi:5-methyltetrahydropteroyltriglutamate--homocysteine methyltransferase
LIRAIAADREGEIMSVSIANLGFPRIGPHRELKVALEKFWSGETDATALLDTAANLRAANWRRQQSAQVSHIPSNDFSLYDHVLDTSVMVGAIPPHYGWASGSVPIETYFAIARGTRGRVGGDLPAQEMTKWFDTNYHYLVPELTRGQTFSLSSTKACDEFQQAKALGIVTRPVLLGPITWLKLAKSKGPDLDPLSLLPGLLSVYRVILQSLSMAGAEWIQMDEPALALNLDDATQAAFRSAYRELAIAAPGLKIMLTSYFGDLGDNLSTVLRLPVAGLHLDLCRAPAQIHAVLAAVSPELTLSLGVIDGRNIWRSDLRNLLDRIEPLIARRNANKLIVAPSCSLLHVPLDVQSERSIDPELKGWLAFAEQKLTELQILARALNHGRSSVSGELEASGRVAHSRQTSPRTNIRSVRERVGTASPTMTQRQNTAPKRRDAQRAHLHLPALPTTTIGSFPQTEAVRKARAAYARKEMDRNSYEAFLRSETEAAVRWQEAVGLDVLVHGEFERNDMVQYFGEQLGGFAFTTHGWVQSYGSRCVRPPIIFGDVSRPRPMTVEWSSYAQSLTTRPMKGMLTGPVTMLQWSFVRDDLPRSDVCRQIALALRDEVTDLETAGIRVIQVDEPAIREGLPLRSADWQSYLDWAVQCFRLATSGVDDQTQIHTHMCYSEFNDIIAAIAAMDADVISIETARSKMELLDAFSDFHYPNQIGPGVYDIHAPRCPTVDEIKSLLRTASRNLSSDQIWVNPDCGLKTRKWEEVRPALLNMVEAARQLRTETV